MLNYLLCFLLPHKFDAVAGSWDKTGRKAVSWSSEIVPEYEQLEKCKRCGKHRTTYWTSAADRGKGLTRLK